MYIIFLTDGLPTVGETNTARIVDDASAINSNVNARIFCFGVGDDVDYDFIDLLSRENGGYTSNVGPYEDLEQPLSDFYQKIKSPVMTNIEVEIDGSRIYDMLPVSLPDLFLGSQLILTGRWGGGGDVSVRLTGNVGNDEVVYTYYTEFTDARGNDFIPRHWATRRVGYLLNQIRLYGENQEVVDEVTELAQRYGIITPYTSMLVTEDEMPRPMEPLAFGAAENLQFADGAGGLGAGISRDRSTALKDMEESGEYALHESIENVVKYEGDKTFYLDENDVWVDSTYNEDDYDLTEIEYLSDEYFDLIDDEPDILDYLTVSDSMIVVWNDKAYQIVPED